MSTLSVQSSTVDNTPIHGCQGCATTGGRMSCYTHGFGAQIAPHYEPEPNPEAGVGAAMALADSVEAARLCRLGYHAFTPWLASPNGTSFWTFCCRCHHQEQFDL